MEFNITKFIPSWCSAVMDGENADGVLTEQFLKSASNEFDVTSIHTISLAQQSITDISAIARCIGLERLDLSHNAITYLQPISSLTNLLVLDVSDNKISSLCGLETLERLEWLNLAGTIEALRSLVSLQNLSSIALRDPVRDVGNPVCMRQSYKMLVLKLLPQLHTLDHEIVKGPNAEVFVMMKEIKEDLAHRNAARDEVSARNVAAPAEVPDDLFMVKRDDELLPAELHFRHSASMSQQLNAKGLQLISEAKERLSATEHV
ncbi:leucine-rich repeat-containing protein 61-like isoform X2 [Watersipora subatra]|uniref:leucine-rich repeat-containing protein 61-like isoform X2 n=1 Tax=Watersipora subatra TaxID=2589382 RepID=UPI00355C5A85